MISEFLAFRYQGLRRPDEIKAKPKDLGWKCRKYIKWHQIHNSKADGKALYAFAEDLIDKDIFRLDLYGQVSAVCLNVQKWRLDKEKLSVDPPARKEWASQEILFKAAQANPAIVSARLRDQKLNLDRLTCQGAQCLFYSAEIDSFFQQQHIEGYPSEPIAKSLLRAKEEEAPKLLNARFDFAYRYLGLRAPKLNDAVKLLRQVAEDLGFSPLTLHPKLSVPSQSDASSPDCIIELTPLEKFCLVEVTSARGITQVRLNSQHPFIKSILDDGKLAPQTELFLKSYAACMLRMAGSIETLETFNSYLGLDLHHASATGANIA